MHISHIKYILYIIFNFPKHLDNYRYEIMHPLVIHIYILYKSFINHNSRMDLANDKNITFPSSKATSFLTDQLCGPQSHGFGQAFAWWLGLERDITLACILDIYIYIVIHIYIYTYLYIYIYIYVYIYWLVVWNMIFMTFRILGIMIPLTNSYFSEGLKPPTSICVCVG